MDLIGLNRVKGRVRAFQLSPHAAEDPENASLFRHVPVVPWRNNLVLYQWAEITAKLLATGDSRYRIGGMYLEFANVASPGNTVSPPSFNRDRTVDYYNDLISSPTADYLRVPMTAITTESSGNGLEQNILTCFARSSGLTGVHGKSFSYASNSVIYGAALVAFVDATDATQDLLFSCFYFDPADQQPKLSTSQVGLEWQITLE